VGVCLHVPDVRLSRGETVVAAERDNETKNLNDGVVQSERKRCSDVQGRLAEAVGCPRVGADYATEPTVGEFAVGLESAELLGSTTSPTLQDK